jgi:type IV secretion system protein VirD4
VPKLLSAMLATIVFAYPGTLSIEHGVNPMFWPQAAIRPEGWFADFTSLAGLGQVVGAYWGILTGQSSVLSNGGWSLSLLIGFAPLAFAVFVRLAPKPPAAKRDVAGTFGRARFASDAERAAMTRGLELGIDPKTGRAVRIPVEGTLVTIAPPRTGKTSGLLIPNLSYPEPGAWAGPAVVLDTKGEVYRATRARRESMGRRVVCLDPIDLVGGNDRWNPLASLQADDILYMQKTALALLPESGSGSGAEDYFRNRAIDLIVGAISVSLRADLRSVVDVHRLLTDEAAFIEGLKSEGAQPAALAALEIMQADPRTRDPIRSTALQAFQWLADRRMRHLVGDSSFDFAELSKNEIDIFVAIPPEHKHVLAPLLRWFLSDLFTSIRRNRPEMRVVLFVDEAAAIGRYDELLVASAELPGYGASIWSFYHDFKQLENLWSSAGASTIVNTAEVVTVSNVSAVDPAETDRWSRALGNYTALVETFSRPATGTGSSTINSGPQPAPLMSPDALATMPSNELLVFPNGRGQTRHPLRLRKTIAHADHRIRPLVEAVAPVGRAS